MNYELFIAKRYLKSKKRIGFISFISYLSIAGVTIGVASIILTLSILNGFEKEIKDKIVGFDSHIRLKVFHNTPFYDYTAVLEKVNKIEHVKAAFPYVNREAMIKSRSSSDGVFVEGIPPEALPLVPSISENIVEGELGFYPKYSGGRDALPGLIIGKKLALKLNAMPGDTVILFSIKGIPSIYNQPYAKRFIINGVYETGMSDYDDVLVYSDIKSAKSLFKMDDSVTGLEIRLNDILNTDLVVNRLNEILGYPYYPITWFDRHRNLFSWLKIQKYPIMIIFGLIIVVAVFNIISTLIMVVIEKTRDIGILKSMGSKNSGVLKVFLFKGFLIGLIGTVMGSAIAGLLGFIQNTFKIFSLPPDVYFMDALPVLMNPLDFLIIGLLAIAICTAATLYPAGKAARMNPAEAIRYE